MPNESELPSEQAMKAAGDIVLNIAYLEDKAAHDLDRGLKLIAAIIDRHTRADPATHQLGGWNEAIEATSELAASYGGTIGRTLALEILALTRTAAPVQLAGDSVSRAAVLKAIQDYFNEMDLVYKAEHRGVVRMACESVAIAVRCLPAAPVVADQDARIAQLEAALLLCAIPYEALLMDSASRKWIAPAVWTAIEKAVAAIRAALPASPVTEGEQ